MAIKPYIINVTRELFRDSIYQLPWQLIPMNLPNHHKKVATQVVSILVLWIFKESNDNATSRNTHVDIRMIGPHLEDASVNIN